MSARGGDAVSFLLVGGLIAWGWSAYTRNTVSAYWVDSKTGEAVAEERFSADRSSNTVVEFMRDPGRETGSFMTHKNCIVLDHKNWWCEIGYASYNGDVKGSTFESDSRVRSASWLKYMFARPQKQQKSP